MKLTKSISTDFVVLPARWQADRARELILAHPSISHAIVATEPYSILYSPTEAPEVISSQDLLLEIPKINIELTQRPWSELHLSPAGHLYVVGRDEFIGFDEEE